MREMEYLLAGDASHDCFDKNFSDASPTINGEPT